MCREDHNSRMKSLGYIEIQNLQSREKAVFFSHSRISVSMDVSRPLEIDAGLLTVTDTNPLDVAAYAFVLFSRLLNKFLSLEQQYKY